MRCAFATCDFVWQPQMKIPSVMSFTAGATMQYACVATLDHPPALNHPGALEEGLVAQCRRGQAGAEVDPAGDPRSVVDVVVWALDAGKAVAVADHHPGVDVDRGLRAVRGRGLPRLDQVVAV